MDEKNCVRLYICSPLRAETKNQVALFFVFSCFTIVVILAQPPISRVPLAIHGTL